MSSKSAEMFDFPSGKTKPMTSRPEAMVELPADNKKLVDTSLDIIGICRNDAGSRAAYYRTLNQIVETGKADGSRSIINLLYRMLDRLSSLLFSPAEIKFSMDFENEYTEDILARGGVVSRLMSKSWERSSTDLLFAQGVFESLKYGAAILKQWPSQQGQNRLPFYHSSLVMPWQFGVYRPDNADLDTQPAMTETVMLTLPEVWRRIWHMPDARQLFDRIKQHSASGNQTEIANSFFHQVLSTSPINTSGIASAPRPGGIVQVSNAGNNTGFVPDSGAAMVMMHELWMWDQSDYVTIQIIEPDILIAPRYRRSNLLAAGMDSCLHPYSLIQCNQAHGNIWGRSELADLIEPQDFLSTTAADMRRLFGVQVDKILAFTGDGLTDEAYDQMRGAGYANLGPGGGVQDLTPKFPPEALAMIDKIIQIMEMIGGFDNLLSGRGETGVRSGVQSSPLMKTAGAPVKDRSLIIERQCAQAAQLRFELMKIKDGRTFWTDKKKPAETSFLLGDIPEDGRIVVDGHTTSPVFADENLGLLTNGVKMGVVDPVSYIEQAPFQQKDVLIARLQAKEEKQAAMLAELRKSDPEEWAKVIEKAAGGHKR